MATHLGVGLVDDKGKEFFRYYPSLKARASNLVLLSPLGFDDIEQAVLPFRGLNLYVYTPAADAPAIGMRMGAIWTSSDRVALMTRLQRQPTLYIPHDD